MQTQFTDAHSAPSSFSLAAQVTGCSATGGAFYFLVRKFSLGIVDTRRESHICGHSAPSSFSLATHVAGCSATGGAF